MLVPLLSLSGSWLSDELYTYPVFTKDDIVKVTFVIWVDIEDLPRVHFPLVSVVHVVLPVVPSLQIPVTLMPLIRSWFWSWTVTATAGIHLEPPAVLTLSRSPTWIKIGGCEGVKVAVGVRIWVGVVGKVGDRVGVGVWVGVIMLVEARVGLEEGVYVIVGGGVTVEVGLGVSV
jgi:hypothetical protein